MARPRDWPGFRKILAELLKLWPCDAESRYDAVTRRRQRRCDAESQGGSGDLNLPRCKRAISCRSASETSPPRLRTAHTSACGVEIVVAAGRRVRHPLFGLMLVTLRTRPSTNVDHT